MKMVQHGTIPPDLDPSVAEQTSHLTQAIVEAVINHNMNPMAALSGIVSALVYLAHARNIAPDELRQLISDYPIEEIMAGYDQDRLDALAEMPVGGSA